MPVYGGSQGFKDVYIGNAAIAKVYVGNTLVYNKIPPFITNGLITYFRFDTNYNNEAGLYSLTTPSIPAGFSLNTTPANVKNGTAAMFINGSNVAYTYTPSLYTDVFNNFSISAWVIPLSTLSLHTPATNNVYVSGNRFLTINAHGGTPALNRFGIGLGIGTNGITVGAHRDNVATILYNASRTFSTTVYSHVVLTCNNKVFTAYVDGVAITGNQVTAGETYAMGLGFGGAYGTYHGYADEVAQWNRALTAAEVTQLYNNGNGLFL